jgi:hypothetical protein
MPNQSPLGHSLGHAPEIPGQECNQVTGPTQIPRTFYARIGLIPGQTGLRNVRTCVSPS